MILGTLAMKYRAGPEQGEDKDVGKGWRWNTLPYLDIRRARFTWLAEIVWVAGGVDTEHDLRLIFHSFYLL